MRNERWSPRDIENLIAGRIPIEGDLECLAPLMDNLRKEARALPDDAIAAVVPRFALEALESKPPRRNAQTQPVSWRRRTVVVAGAVALATAGIGGAAVASDGAAPGDFLYPVDQAFEVLGIGNGGVEEKLQESVRLTERGQPEWALEHAAKALEQEGDGDSAQALVRTAAEVKNQGAERSVQVQSQVAEMLQWMGSEVPQGKGYGAELTERASQIRETARGKSEEAPGRDKDDEGPPSGRGDDNPGRGDDNPGRGDDNPGRGNARPPHIPED